MAVQTDDIVDWATIPPGTEIQSLAVRAPDYKIFFADAVFQGINPKTGITDLAFLAYVPSQIVNTAILRKADPVELEDVGLTARPQLSEVALCKASTPQAISMALAIIQTHLGVVPELTRQAILDLGFLALRDGA